MVRRQNRRMMVGFMSGCLRPALPALLLAAALLCPAGADARPAPAGVDVCFVPSNACAARIVAAIDAARREVRVQAYGFTSAVVIAALLRAHARGVDVAVLLDRSNERGRHPGLSALRAAGVPVWIDAVRGIAHVKAVVIDRHLVIGGSYNYTASAERRNVEDVTFTESEEIAARFLRDWRARRAVARPPRVR
jgi:phosphatidylserine/phosphatidylglycerophosphate/cardiolipin synthase-like enzyme